MFYVDRGRAVWEAKWLIIAVGFVVELIAGFIAQQHHNDYQSTALVSINVVSAQIGGGVQDIVNGSNDVAAQYAQVVDTDAIVGPAAATLGNRGPGLTGATSAATVSSQNLVKITCTGKDAATAAARTKAVTSSFKTYLDAQNTESVASYSKAVAGRLAPLDASIAAQERVVASLNGAAAGAPAGGASIEAAADARALLRDLVDQRARTATDAATDAGVAPSIRVVSSASPGSQTGVSPFVIALVGFPLGALVAAQIAVERARARAGREYDRATDLLVQRSDRDPTQFSAHRLET